MAYLQEAPSFLSCHHRILVVERRTWRCPVNLNSTVETVACCLLPAAPRAHAAAPLFQPRPLQPPKHPLGHLLSFSPAFNMMSLTRPPSSTRGRCLVGDNLLRCLAPHLGRCPLPSQPYLAPWLSRLLAPLVRSRQERLMQLQAAWRRLEAYHPGSKKAPQKAHLRRSSPAHQCRPAGIQV